MNRVPAIYEAGLLNPAFLDAMIEESDRLFPIDSGDDASMLDFMVGADQHSLGHDEWICID